MTDRRFRRWLVAIALVGLLFRWGYAVAAKTDLLEPIGVANTDCVVPRFGPDADGVDPDVPPTCDEPLLGDAIYYSAQADVIAEGRWFTHPITGEEAADHAPLTALALAPASVVAGEHSVIEQRLLMSIYGTATILVMGLVGRRLAGPRAGLVAAALAAASPNLWMNDVIAMSETFAALGVATILLTVYRFADRPTLVRAAWVGVACGVTTLARAELAMLVPLVMGPVCWWARSLVPWARVGRFVLAGAVAAAVVAPWMVYNLGRFEERVLFSTNDGLTLIGANCEPVYEGGGIGFWNLGCAFALEVDPALDQSQESKVYRDAAIEFISNNQTRLPAVLLARVGRVWGVYAPDQMVHLNTGEAREESASWAGMVMWWITVPFAVAGAVVLRRRGTMIWPLVAMAVAVTVTALAFYGIVRFRIPADVAALLLAAVAVDGLLRRYRPSRGPSARAPAATASSPERSGPSPVPELSAGEHFPCLDSYRGIGMLMVLVIHSAFATGYEQRSGEIGRLIARLDLGIPIFFVLSAFLLYRPMARAALTSRPPLPTPRFLRRRALRIFPGYWAALVLIPLLALVSLVPPLDVPSVADWVANAFLLQGFGVDAPYALTQAWSIGVEAGFYVALPLYALVLWRLVRDRAPETRLRAMLWGVGLWYLAGQTLRIVVVLTEPSWASQSLLWMPMYADIFAVGMGLAVLSAAHSTGRPLPRWLARLAEHPALCWSATLVLFLAISRLDPPATPFAIEGGEYVLRQAVYGLAALLFLVPGMFGDFSAGRIRALLRSRPLVYLGTVSFSIYLWHLAFIEQAKVWTVPDYDQLEGLATFRGNVVVVAGIALCCSLLVASVLFRLVEVPFLELKDRPLRTLGRRRPTDTRADRAAAEPQEPART